MIHKPIPEPKFLLIRPPSKNYKYFEDFAHNPFRPDATGFELVNAGWLADFSLLVYGNETFIKDHTPELTAAGFKIKFISVATTQGLVAHNARFIVIAIRGTEIDNLRGALADWVFDLQFNLVPDESHGRIHQGFKKLIDQAWPKIETYVRKIQADGVQRTLWITGHSSGAALATLAAERARRVARFPVAGVYTWGSPRVGDDAFKQKYADVGLADRTFRFVNNTDIAPSLFPGADYTHVGLLKFIDADGKLHDLVAEPSIEVETDPLSGLTTSNAPTEESLDIIIPSLFADHAPIYYASYVWNNL